jgi:hypothetical protein
MRILLAALALTAAVVLAQRPATPPAQTPPTAVPPTSVPPAQVPPEKRAPTTSPKKSVNPDDPNAEVIKEFLKRVDAYVAAHKKVEDTLPPLPKQTTPQNMDQHERALAKLIQAARKGAKQGDIFTRQMQTLVKRLLLPIFSGTDGAHVRSEIMDNEYKGNVVLTPNGRYPDDIPVSTVPPQVLQFLPKLPEEMEYRFVRQNLILFDPHAHLIPDWVPQAFK